MTVLSQVSEVAPHRIRESTPRAVFEPHDEPRRIWYLPCKATIEWVLALVLVVLSAPVILVLAALVRLSSHGPAFYLQTRVGKYGRCFRMLKLRTMIYNCEAKTGPVWSQPSGVTLASLGCDHTGPVLASQL